MNIFDVIIILLIISSGVTGYKKGVLKEAVVFIGTILIYIVAFNLKDNFGVLLCKLCPFFELDGFVTLNILIYQMIAFTLIASVLFSIFGLIVKFTKVVQKLVDASIILEIPSKILGFIFGLIEGYIVMFIVLIVIAVFLRNVSIFNNSNLANKIMYDSPILKDTVGDLGSAISDIITLTSRIESKEKDNINSINISIMKSYLDYKIISREDALKIINTNKLESVSGIESFVNNYQ